MNTFSIPIIIINLYFYFIIFYKTSKITRNKKHETKNTKQETRPLTKKKKKKPQPDSYVQARKVLYIEHEW